MRALNLSLCASLIALNLTSFLSAETYRTEMLAYPPPWSFQERHSGIIFVGDSQLEEMAADPDKPINLSLSETPRMQSLRQVCEQAQARGSRTLSLAFDYFWAQYRKEFAGKPRALWPDTPRYIELIGKIAAVAQDHGLGMKLSVLSPLEIGHGYGEETGEHGRWMHYRKGVRDPSSGAYSVQLWRQCSWTNNKGTVAVHDAGIRVFAFKERRVPNTDYYVVKPDEIVEISDAAEVEIMDGTRADADSIQSAGTDPTALAGYRAVRVRVFGKGDTDVGGLNRVLVVQLYRTPEMDYFSDSAETYLRGLLDRYIAAGVRFHALYADEMHIQGDWGYASHHDHGEFALRYVSPGFEKQFAEKFGPQYGDFAKWLIYFCRGQQDMANDITAKSNSMHVMGESPQAIAQTALLRSRYFKTLNDGVIELFAGAKSYLEQQMGHSVSSQAHATWAESPTIDHVKTSERGPWIWKYDYTPRFIASNTVHQAATVCADYFKWCEFLHGTGNDTAECGWLDRNYWGFSLASSLGTINRVRNAYAAHWGMPQEIRQRRSALKDAWGTWPDWSFGIVQNMDPRQVDVLTLYPNDLVAWDERFGSWMTQYAYTNYMPQSQVLEFGQIRDGKLKVGNAAYSTLVVAFEPFPDKELLGLMTEFARQGGRVIWSGPPPTLFRDGTDATQAWQTLTGTRHSARPQDGLPVPGYQISFTGVLADVESQLVLTDQLPDRIYPLEIISGTAVAHCNEWIVGGHRTLGKGTVTTLGFRPRDDQAASLGYDVRSWFEILNTLGAYPASGRFSGINDNTEVIARTGDLFACQFPNGAISMAPHLKSVAEQWPGGFHRDQEVDRQIVERLELPSEQISLVDFKVAGHAVSFTGQRAMCFRTGVDGALIAFAGHGCDRIELDGKQFVFADRPFPRISWGPVPNDQRVIGGAVYLARAAGKGELRLPLGELRQPYVVAEGRLLGEPGEEIRSSYDQGTLTFETRQPLTWYFILERQAE
jgi:hypothetical protein